MKQQRHDMTTGGLPVRWAAATDRGRVRADNQDAFYADLDRGLFLVADGMGGHPGGAMASMLIVKTLPCLLEAHLTRADVSRPGQVQRTVEITIVDLGKYLRDKAAEKPGLTGMGATLVMALFCRRRLYVVNMGDSRAYLLRDHRLCLQSEEHSLVGLLLRHKCIERSEMSGHPARGQLTRYVGMPENVYPYVKEVWLQHRDRFLLCTDGLTDVVPENKITGILCEQEDPEQACRALVDAANAAGGPDNISVLIVDWLGQPQDAARCERSKSHVGWRSE